MKTIRVCINQAFSSKGFITGFIAMFALIMISGLGEIANAFNAEDPLAFGFHHDFLLNSLSSDTVTIAIPILCSLPFAASYLDDVKSGFAKYFLSRSSMNAYISGKIAGCGLSGGAVLVLGVVCAWITSILLLLPLQYAPDKANPLLYMTGTVLQKMIVLFLTGAFFSICGMAFSAVSENKYIAFASPFVFYYVLIMLNERYLREMNSLYPKAWLDTVNFYPAAILMAVLIAIASLLFKISAERRLRNV